MALLDRFEADDIDARRLSLGEHLEELRKHVLKSLGWLVLAMVAALCFQTPLMNWATWPHRKTMDELQHEFVYRTANKNLDDRFVRKVETTLVEAGALEKEMRAVERNATIVKEKLDQDPQKRVEGLRAREVALAGKLATLRAEQERLLAAPDAAKFETLEKDRRALMDELVALSSDLKRDLAPLSETGDVRVPKVELIQLRYTEGFMAYVKVSLVCALFIASPLIARELWKFVSAGLHTHEKRYVRLFAPLTFVAFVIGASFGYFVLIPAGLKFLATYGDDYIVGQFALSDYLSLFIGFTLVVGLIFELPLVMTFIALLGFLTPEAYARFRRYWVLVAFILAALISPTPDPVTQVLCAVPLLLLYEIGIWSSRWVVGRRKRELELQATRSTTLPS